MANFLIYDLALLGLFVIFVVIFLYRKRHNLKREGLLWLYKTRWGIKLIDRIGKKYKKTLNVMSYLSIASGYLLMAGMIYLLGRIIWIYVFHPSVVKLVKVPPITPLVPYLPQVFKLDFLPSFFFIYWILIIAIIAITHEFAHGIFATYNKVKIKSTGFGFFPFFLPVFLAAFVEPNEKQMQKKKIKPQLAILSAGTFFNLLGAIMFFLVMWLFFSLAFSPGGVVFDDYANTIVNIKDITHINGKPVINPTYEKILEEVSDDELNEIKTRQGEFLISKQLLSFPGSHTDELVRLYIDSPAIREQIKGAITQVDGEKIINLDSLTKELSKHAPGERINITLNQGSEIIETSIILEEHPQKEGSSWLGIVFLERQTSGVINKIILFFTSFKQPHIFYESNIGDAGEFIYNLLWWLVIIAFSVALINMLPMGIFDGGRFFYLTILAITKSKKTANISYKVLTHLILYLIILLMIIWVFGVF